MFHFRTYCPQLSFPRRRESRKIEHNIGETDTLIETCAKAGTACARNSLAILRMSAKRLIEGPGQSAKLEIVNNSPTSF